VSRNVVRGIAILAAVAAAIPIVGYVVAEGVAASGGTPRSLGRKPGAKRRLPS